jgi:O-antigen ligase
MPYISFKRWLREIIAVIMALIVATEPDVRHALQSLFRRTIYILIPFSYILIHYFPQYGREYGRWSGVLMWTGVASQKNGLAMLCLFSTFFLIFTLLRRWQGRNKPIVYYQTIVEVFILFLTIWLFLGPQQTLTYSATSFVALAAGLTYLLGLLWLKKVGILISSNMLTIIILMIIVYGTVTPFIGKLSIIDLSSALNRSETLTNRTDIWAYLIPYAMKNPIVGYGFGGFWKDSIREATSSHAHNGYLDIILNIGFTGFIFFFFILYKLLPQVQKTLLHDFYWGIFGIFFWMAIIYII